MKIMVIFDSAFGNTEKIARSIADAFGLSEEVEIFRVTEVSPQQLNGIDLLIVGSPTQGFRPLPSIQNFLDKIPSSALQGIKVAAFDTRIGGKGAGTAGRFVARLGGYAAPRLAGVLKKKGGNLISEPEGFVVSDSKGPLGQGETERAATWAKAILENLKS